MASIRTPPSLAELRQAKAAVKDRLHGWEGVEGVGLGDACVRVYVRDAGVGRRLPRRVAGVRVEPVVTGGIVAH